MSASKSALHSLAVVLVLAGLACSGNPDTSEGRSAPPDSLVSPAMTAMQIEARRDSLIREGLYECCTDPGCTECVTLRDSCECYVAIRQKDPICGGCLRGYKEGRGRLKLVSITELEEIRDRAGAPPKTP